MVMLCGRSVPHFPEKQMTPGGATELMEVLGKEESIARIKAAIEKLAAEA